MSLAQNRTVKNLQEWSTHQLGHLADVATGSTPPTADRRNYGDEYLFVSPADLGGSKYISRTSKMLSRQGFSKSRNFPKDSVLFVCIGSTIGKCAMASQELTSNQQINAVLPSPNVSMEYIYYALTAQADLIAGSAGEQAVPIVNKTSFAATIIPLPPTLAEQQAIAEALSDADALIEGLSSLIAKKRAIKQGAMQDLLTGNRRLPGFEGEWAKCPLVQLGRWVGGATPSMSRADFWDGGTIAWASSSDVRIGPVHTTAHKITERAVRESSATLVPIGSILLVTRSGILRRFLPVGLAVGPIAINQDIKALIPAEGVIGAFAFHSIVGAGPEILGACMKSGTTVESIELGWLKRFEIDVPSNPIEQTAIAAVLSDMDAEIEALEAKLTKARAVKQGMMQELLTGRVRLI